MTSPETRNVTEVWNVVWLLFWKEVRQLTRNTAAMLTVLFMPAVLVLLAPILAILASRSQPYRSLRVPALAQSLPGFWVIHDGQGYLLFVTLPFLFVLAAMLTPILSAIHTLIAEREPRDEQRSLDLLLALPVLVGDVVTAKLAAVLGMALITILPMFLVDAVVIASVADLGDQTTSYLGGALFLLLATLVASIGASLLLALLARDVRGATALGGLLTVPPMVLTSLCVTFVPGPGRFVLLGLLMIAMGSGAIYAGLRWLSPERYLAA
jgi:ABC-type Na+ efflux pump permease subunit